MNVQVEGERPGNKQAMLDMLREVIKDYENASSPMPARTIESHPKTPSRELIDREVLGKFSPKA